jgi:hypothetical protein
VCEELVFIRKVRNEKESDDAEKDRGCAFDNLREKTPMNLVGTIEPRLPTNIQDHPAIPSFLSRRLNKYATIAPNPLIPIERT